MEICFCRQNASWLRSLLSHSRNRRMISSGLCLFCFIVADSGRNRPPIPISNRPGIPIQFGHPFRSKEGHSGRPDLILPEWLHLIRPVTQRTLDNPICYEIFSLSNRKLLQPLPIRFCEEGYRSTGCSKNKNTLNVNTISELVIRSVEFSFLLQVSDQSRFQILPAPINNQ